MYPCCISILYLKSIEVTKFSNDIDDGVKALATYQTNDFISHIIYCYGGSSVMAGFAELKRVILPKMKKYGIQSLILTKLYMRRNGLITKEIAKTAYERNLIFDNQWSTMYGGSINDDLEFFHKNIQTRKPIEPKYLDSFFLPKLTKDELKLVEDKNEGGTAIKSGLNTLLNHVTWSMPHWFTQMTIEVLSD